MNNGSALNHLYPNISSSYIEYNGVEWNNNIGNMDYLIELSAYIDFLNLIIVHQH